MMNNSIGPFALKIASNCFMIKNKRMNYNHQKIEKKWQAVWAKNGYKLWRAKDEAASASSLSLRATASRGKKYVLDMFPYPSGEGLHVGHLLGYVGSDILSRYYRMRGFNVLHPMGWDAFGLPAENYALKHKIHPEVAVKKNIKNFKRQLQAPGFSYDWSREINTTDPNYYKWTQWIFLQMFKKGLAYEANIPVNWCPQDKTVLANEEVVDGCCERCGAAVERKNLKQWVLKITAYADRLLKDLDALDWPEKVKELQRNWIGRSEGALIKFPIKETPRLRSEDNLVEVFTTRPDTLAGATYLVLAPEHALLRNKELGIRNQAEVEKYVLWAKNRSDRERQENKEKTGVELKGIKAINPLNNEELPVWVADYVLGNYGTGAIMAVPAHDERDFAFAKKFNLPIISVIEPVTGEPKENEERRVGIVAIVRNPKTNKLLSLNWGDGGGYLFVGGGAEVGESAVECAIREIREETGYRNVKLVAQSEKMHHHYFAFAKNKYREMTAIGLYFELVDEQKIDQKLEAHEQGKFKVEWITEREAEERVKDPGHYHLFKKFVQGKGYYVGTGIVWNSGRFDGLQSEDAKKQIIAWLEKNNAGKKTTNYKLRDWIFSRQRYWGEPIPVIHCLDCGTVAVPEKDLPVKLPKVKSYEPTGTGESPLANIKHWVEVRCPQCGKKARRETNTMPQWAGSCWYYAAYLFGNQKNKKAKKQESNLAEFKKVFDQWLPVDLYIGGVEHAVLHLLYARFWHKFLFDIGVVGTIEPFQKLMNQGLMMGPDGQKMSKSKGNVINPDEMIEKFGADALRMYEMFMGPFEDAKAWDPNGIVGIARFLNRFWTFVTANVKTKETSDKALYPVHRTIKKVTEDIEKFRFNTAISAMMVLLNEVGSLPVAKNELVPIVKVLSPFAPHIAQELYSQLGSKKLLDNESWPEWDAKLAEEEIFDLVVQVNGRTRGKMKAVKGIAEHEAKELALDNADVKKWVTGDVKKVIFVKDRLINLIVG